MAETRRPKRQCAARRSTAPSAVHYVGYVEDDETPEMIMKKFEEMEKVKAAVAGPVLSAAENETDNCEVEVGPDPDLHCEGCSSLAGLTEGQLLEVFKQTSIFNVRSALAGNNSLMDGDALEASFDRLSDEEDMEDEGLWSDVRGFWSDEDDATYDNHWKKTKGKGKKEAQVRGFSHSKPRHDVVTSYNTTTRALIRKKIRVYDKHALVQIKIPYPLQLSWGRTVKPYVPVTSRDCELQSGQQYHDRDCDQLSSKTFELDKVLSTNWHELRKDYQGVMINPGWEVSDEGAARSFARLPIPKLCPIGFVFIWIKKKQISAVIEQMTRWGYTYIENLTWVYINYNNTVMRLPSDHVQSSHLTLFLFRREGQGKGIELRHQRKPDVVFDTIRRAHEQDFEVPEEAYITIETLLPSGQGKFLELWATRGLGRPGWTHVTDLSGSKLIQTL